MTDKECLNLLEVTPGKYWDNKGIVWEDIDYETCEECGVEGCYVSDEGERLCPQCMELKYDVMWV